MKVSEPLPHPHQLHTREQLHWQSRRWPILKLIQTNKKFPVKENSHFSYLYLRGNNAAAAGSRVKEKPEDGRTAYAQTWPPPL